MARPKIVDEFTDLPISRERKRQLRFQRDNPELSRRIMSERFKKYYYRHREYRVEASKQWRIRNLL